jgi:hypothetical protein
LDEDWIVQHFDDLAILASLQLELERIRLYTREINIFEKTILETVAGEHRLNIFNRILL